mgnify:CR=1 FL=1
MYNKDDPVIKSLGDKCKSYTCIRFKPDFNKFGISGLSDDMISLFKNEKLLLDFKKSAFEKAKMFDIQYILPKYEQFYQLIIKANS